MTRSSDWRKNLPPKGGIKTLAAHPPEDWVVPEHSFFQNNFFVLPALPGCRAILAPRRRGTPSHRRLLRVGFFGLSLADAVDSFLGWNSTFLPSRPRENQRRWESPGEFVAGDTDLLPYLAPGKLDPDRTAVLLIRLGSAAAPSLKGASRNGPRPDFLTSAVIPPPWRGT